MNIHKNIEISPGRAIDSACDEAVQIARRDGCSVAFAFNDIKLVALPDSDPAALAQAYVDECQRRRDAYIASPEYKQQQEEAAREQREREERLSAMLAGTPEHMTLRDPDGWKLACEKNTDPYGGAVITYCERWARLMEARMSNGEKIADIADDCSHLADSEGITGFMYGCAVGILAKVWIHGEALRLWQCNAAPFLHRKLQRRRFLREVAALSLP